MARQRVHTDLNTVTVTLRPLQRFLTVINVRTTCNKFLNIFHNIINFYVFSRN